MTRLLVLFALIWAVFILDAQSHEYLLDISVGGYASTAPHSAGRFTFAFCPSLKGCSMLSYTTFEARPIDSRRASFTTQTGVMKRLFTNAIVELDALAQAGVATNAQATSGIFSAEGIVVAKKTPLHRFGMDPILGGGFRQAPLEGGSDANIFLGLRFHFSE